MQRSFELLAYSLLFASISLEAALARPVQACPVTRAIADHASLPPNDDCTPIDPRPLPDPRPIPPPEPTPTPRPILDRHCNPNGLPLQPATNGSGVLFDENCSTAFVLPPQTATVEVAELTPVANVESCPAVLSLHLQLEDTLAQLDGLEATIETYLEEFDALQAEVVSLQAQLDAAGAARDAADASMVDAANRRAVLSAARSDADLDYEVCVLLDSEDACTAQLTRRDSARAEFEAHEAEVYGPALALADATDQVYRVLFDAFEAALDALTSGLDPVLELIAQLEAASAAVEASYGHFAALEGARGTLRYSVPWDALLDDYRGSNPGASLHFSPIPIRTATLSATAVLAGDTSTIPVQLWARLPESGDEVMQRGGAVMAEIGLGLVGACPYFPDGQLTAPVTLDRSALAAYVTANVAYRYDAYAPATYVEGLDESPVVAKIKQVSATFDPLAPTAIAKAVRRAAEVEAFAEEALSSSERHDVLRWKVSTLERETVEVAAQRRVEKLALQPTAAQPSEAIALQSTKAGVATQSDLLAVPATRAAATQPAASPQPKAAATKQMALPIERPIRPVYTRIERQGALTFIP